MWLTLCTGRLLFRARPLYHGHFGRPESLFEISKPSYEASFLQKQESSDFPQKATTLDPSFRWDDVSGGVSGDRFTGRSGFGRDAFDHAPEKLEEHRD